jgi:hypothetical protein
VGSGITAGGTNGAVIGGNVAGAANVVSGNAFQGIVVTSGATGTTIQGNFIGTNPAGSVAIPNASGGIRDVTGVSTAVVNNLISGNAFNAIAADGTASGMLVVGNLIGTNPAGTAALPNGGGISVAAPGSTIGGTVAGTRTSSRNTARASSQQQQHHGARELHRHELAGTAKIANSQGIRILSGRARSSAGPSPGRQRHLGNTNDGIVIDGGVSGSRSRKFRQHH